MIICIGLTSLTIGVQCQTVLLAALNIGSTTVELVIAKVKCVVSY